MSTDCCDDRVTAYLSSHKQWAIPLEQIRTLLLASDLEETITVSYTHLTLPTIYSV